MHPDTSSHRHPQPPQTTFLTATLGPETRPDSEPLRKKDGTLSKIRSHRGNVPVLPQTKLCPHCPAKFTRTTHLNRHLRNHTNERLHRCETCNSQFTRSDLLNRHKKSCDNPSNRCRTRSCLACIESKIKCDRQTPCSKCFSKMTECVYGPPMRKGPDTTRTAAHSSLALWHHAEHNNSLSISNTSPSHTPSHLNQVSSSAPSYLNYPLVTSHTSSSSASIQTLELLHPIQTHGIAYTQDSQSPKGNQQEADLTGPPVEPFLQASLSAPISSNYSPEQCSGGYLTENVAEGSLPTSFTADNQLVPVSSHLSPAYGSGDIFAPFFTSIFPDLQSYSNLSEVILNVEELNVRGNSLEDFAPLAPSLPSDSSAPAVHSTVFSSHIYQSGPYVTYEVDRGQKRLRHIGPDPTSTELQQYLHIFFTTFLTQIPILHPPTFCAVAKSPILLRAMQACGALFIENKRANNFVSKTLAYARETLVYDFAWNSNDPMDQIQLILAVVLLQTIGLFHQDMDQRNSSNLYHGMLVMMIRQAGLISQNANWKPQHLDESNLEEVWLDWARHEMAKRAILWSFMHDCCHCIYFALPSSYHPHEMALNLPCESALWQANTAAEWYSILQDPLLDGSIQASRLIGISIPKMVAYLSEIRTTPTVIPLSAIAHFVLIHIFLKQLFEHCVGGRPTMPDSVGEGNEMDSELFALQLAMHNWLQNWKNCHESQRKAGCSEPPFIKNLLPFYWLGQIAILAYQDRRPPFERDSRDNLKAGDRFRLVKRWLRQIRNFLKNQDESATLYWDELMHLRLHSWQQDNSQNEGEEGLLEFFPDDS